MPILLRPKRETTLLLFLNEALSDWRPRTVKDRLKGRCVCVNGEVVTHHRFVLRENDHVEVHKSPVNVENVGGGIRILYQDASLVGILKPAGLLSVGTEQVPTKHALAMVRDALGARQKLWPVHRLDRETSGVLLFARSREICDALQSNWKRVTKVYRAVVEGHASPPEGVIDQPLCEDKNLMVRVRHHGDAKESRTIYKTLKKGIERSLLEIQLDTGRRHQIRAHLAWLGHPVVGDGRYGRKSTRMALHAQRLSFQHPVSDEAVVLRAQTPSEFQRLLRGSNTRKKTSR